MNFDAGLQQRSIVRAAGMKDDLIVRVEVKLSPEIKVFIGQPQLT